YEKRPFSCFWGDARARPSRPASNGLNAALRVLSGSEEFLTLGLFWDVVEPAIEESSKLPVCPTRNCLNASSETDFSEIRLRLRRDAPSQSFFNISFSLLVLSASPLPFCSLTLFLVFV